MSEDIPRLEAKLDAQGQRIAVLERNSQDHRTEQAVRAERDKHLDRRFDKIEGGVDEVKGYLLKIVWVIVFGILSALITFIVRGGISGTF